MRVVPGRRTDEGQERLPRRRTPSAVERLVQRWRPQRPRRLTARERCVEARSALLLVAVAVAMPLALPSERALSAEVLFALLAGHVAGARIRLYTGAGCAMPTQLVLVPMLFLLPVALVPAVVVCGLVLAASSDVLRGRAHPERLVSAIADAWHVVGSSAVLAAAGEPGLALQAWPVLAGALVAQLAADLASATLREWLGRGIAPVLQMRVLASVHLIDLCLTPIGMLGVVAATIHPLGFLAVLPLLPLLAAFASDRRARIEEVGARLDELQDERRRLHSAIHRIGDAFASKLDRSALADIALHTASEALQAARGRAVLAGVAVETGPPDARLDAVLDRAVELAQLHRVPQMVAECERFALACPLEQVAGGDRVADMLVVARRGRAFDEQEQALVRHLAGQARVAMENVDLHDRLRRQATSDELTGLANHRRFQEVIGEEVRRSRRSQHPMALVMFDIDNFKAVNDNHGHQQGDLVLREVARAIAGSARGTDKPARYGGEEIAVVLPDTDLDGAWTAAETMRRAVEALEFPLPDGSSLRVTVSAGVSAWCPEMDEVGALMGAADGALYEAKRGGKNRTVRGRPRSGRSDSRNAAQRRFADARC